MPFPDRTDSIAFNREMIVRSRARGDIAMTRGAYASLVESWKQQNANAGGAHQHELDAVKKEYSDWVRSDPLYIQIRNAAIEVVRQRSGVMQTELHNLLPQFPKTDVQYALYFAGDHGFIVRTKKSRSYVLSLPTT
jgi:hypothetical protein